MSARLRIICWIGCPEEKLDYKRHPVYGFTMQYLDDLIAAAIDRGDEAVTAAVKDILLSDNNTAVITVDLIRGIIKSSSASLHRLLSDFLLAARLRRGVRQAICENADCGTVEAFQTIFAAVCENNLIRFASVKGRWLSGQESAMWKMRIASRIKCLFS